jgi:hypothetical protein
MLEDDNGDVERSGHKVDKRDVDPALDTSDDSAASMVSFSNIDEGHNSTEMDNLEQKDVAQRQQQIEAAAREQNERFCMKDEDDLSRGVMIMREILRLQAEEAIRNRKYNASIVINSLVRGYRDRVRVAHIRWETNVIKMKKMTRQVSMRPLLMGPVTRELHNTLIVF